MTLRNRIAAAALLTLGLLAAPAASMAAEQQPPKFDVHATQCAGDANQPNCPGSH